MTRIALLIFFSGCIVICSSIYAVPYIIETDTTLQSFAPFPVGAMLSSKNLNNNMYVKRAIEEYNSITTGTIKMDNIRPKENEFSFAGTDYWVDFAQKYGKRIHGHVLIRSGVPDWVLDYDGDSIALEKLMKDHIHAVIARYKGKINSWDVVNEAIDDYGNIKTENIWFRNLGKGYIERAFIYAHEADSDALLFYNDYGHEYSNRRLDSIVSKINRYVKMGIPVHGIGMQMHTRYNLGDERWKNAMKRCATTGLKIHISELDISVNNSPTDSDAVFTPELANIQGQKYKYFFEAYNELPDNQKFGITTWGVGDKDTWIRGTYKRPEWPLPFDDNYERKPAYYGILEGMGVKVTSNDDNAQAMKEIKEKKYYSLFGVEVDSLFKGVLIERIIYSDNSLETKKSICK